MYRYQMNSLPQSREFSQVFGGLNRQIRPSENEFSDMMNLTSTYHPVLSPRDPRGNVREIENCRGLLGKDQLAWVDGSTLHYGDYQMGLSHDEGEERQLISMGAYLIVFPDMMYLNTTDFEDRGPIVSDPKSFEAAAFYPSEEGREASAFALSQRIFAWSKPQKYYCTEGKSIVLTGVPAPADGEIVATNEGYSYYYWYQNSILVNIDYTGAAKISCETSEDGYLSLSFEKMGEQYPETVNRVASVKLALCQKTDTASTVIQDGDAFALHTVFVYTEEYADPPKSACVPGFEDGDTRTFMKSSGSTYLAKYDSNAGQWNQIESFVTVSAQGLGTALTEDRSGFCIIFESSDTSSGRDPEDSVEESTDVEKTVLNGLAVTYEGKYWVTQGSIEKIDEDTVRVEGCMTLSTSKVNANVLLYSSVPEVDFLIECQNRLWGCRYGKNKDGEFVNEIYASAQGSFREWTRFNGTAQDSYVMSLGSDGPFTGAICYRDMPYFFKERCVHSVYGAYPANYQLVTDTSLGLQKECHKSLAVMGGLLYFRSPDGIVCYNGSTSEEIARPLGTDIYTKAVGGCLDGKYYIAQTAENGTRSLFVYDTEKNLWHIEEGAGIEHFARFQHDLYFWDTNTKTLGTVKGTDGKLEDEAAIKWYAESGIIGYSSPDQKYVGRIQLHMSIPVGSLVNIYLEYDSDGYWEFQGGMSGHGLQSYHLPVIPRRCDHFRIRFEGTGPCKIFSIAKMLEQGGWVT